MIVAPTVGGYGPSVGKFLTVWLCSMLINVTLGGDIKHDLVNNQITRGNIDRTDIAAKWFPFIATLFLFILFNNLIGYIPLPTNTEHKFELFGLMIPSFALYAATANISVPLVLTLIVWIGYHVEGIRTHGVRGYFKTWVPAGVEGLRPWRLR